ncbi:XRE family transcriptional regulator [Colidextribacter sp. OB.20]|uniref:helix-turn-helix domain-containing protein n=1 Tax=Colidextribacter sp. OB.20 TaxID=2304568 RepID=UPI00136B1DAE|nr:helix-turn-helix transcriptional regulator [Colidextribacter sp. OB.20]NBI08895.1 XRE family transcriptional regulator [Colidextribacter sp. OB.20]
MSLGSRIYEQRTAHSLSQVDLADLLEVSRQSVSKWETDASVPDLDKLVKMCKVFGVSLDWLVLGKAPEPPPDAPLPAPAQLPSLSRQTAGTALAALGLFALIVMAAARNDVIAGVLLAIPFLACGGLCFLLHKKPLLFLCCGWVVCISLALYLLAQEDPMFPLSCVLGYVNGDIEEYLPAGFLTLLDLIGFIALVVTSLMYDQIFPPEKKHKN